jgi:hypothetical protein
MNRKNRSAARFLAIEEEDGCAIRNGKLLTVPDSQTVKGSAVAGDPQQMYPGIVVRMFPKRGNGEVFAISNRDGVVLVPLRPGQYCFEAFDGDGTGLALDLKQASCFPISLNKTTDVGVVVGAEQ